MNEPILIPYSDVRHKIRDADLLLFRRRNRIARLIAVAGRSQYVHAAMAGWWKDRLMCVEMTSGGGRAQLLSNLVARWPGVIDVYQANATRRRFSRERALRGDDRHHGQAIRLAESLACGPAAHARVPVPGLAGYERRRDVDLASVLFAGGVDGRPAGRRRSRCPTWPTG